MTLGYHAFAVYVFFTDSSKLFILIPDYKKGFAYFIHAKLQKRCKKVHINVSQTRKLRNEQDI